MNPITPAQYADRKRQREKERAQERLRKLKSRKSWMEWSAVWFDGQHA
jgi:hypothetical protein